MAKSGGSSPHLMDIAPSPLSNSAKTTEYDQAKSVENSARCVAFSGHATSRSRIAASEADLASTTIANGLGVILEETRPRTARRRGRFPRLTESVIQLGLEFTHGLHRRPLHLV